MLVKEGNSATKYLAMAEEFCNSFIQINYGPSPDQTEITSIYLNIINLPKSRLDDIKKQHELEDVNIRRSVQESLLPKDKSIVLDVGFFCQAVAQRLQWTTSNATTVIDATTQILADSNKKRIFTILGDQIGGARDPKQIMITYMSGFANLYRQGYCAHVYLHKYLPKIEELDTKIKSIESNIESNFIPSSNDPITVDEMKKKAGDFLNSLNEIVVEINHIDKKFS